MRIFLDVGANTGQSLAGAMVDRFAMDHIVCFEPAKQCWSALYKMADDRVKVERFGLWNKTCKKAIFQPGTKGAGMWKKDQGRRTDTEVCQFIRASEWFAKNIAADDTVFLKLNCEGAECDILDDLMDSGEFAKVGYALVSFDVRKIAKLKHREQEVMVRLAAIGFSNICDINNLTPRKVHADRIAEWLELSGE